MITTKPAFFTSDGKSFATIEEAQFEELSNLLSSALTGESLTAAANIIQNHSAEVIAILSGQPQKPKRKYSKRNNPDKISPRPG